MSIPKKIQKGKVGSIVRIPLNENKTCHSYAQVLKNFHWIFFEFKDCADYYIDIDLEFLFSRNIIFSGTVVDYVRKDLVNKGIWPVVRQADILPAIEAKVPPHFYQNSRGTFLLYYDNSFREVSPENCIGLEINQGWLPHNIVNRLNDFYAGKPFVPGEHYKLKL